MINEALSKHNATYPEHAKLKVIAHLSQACGEFIDHLEMQGFQITRKRSKGFRGKHFNLKDELAKHFDIDQNKLEEEKRAMLEDLRHEPT